MFTDRIDRSVNSVNFLVITGRIKGASKSGIHFSRRRYGRFRHDYQQQLPPTGSEARDDRSVSERGLIRSPGILCFRLIMHKHFRLVVTSILENTLDSEVDNDENNFS